MTQFFKKQKNPILGVFWTPFAQIWAKKEFSREKGLYQFLNNPIIYHGPKNRKKLTSHSWEKYQTDGRTNHHGFIGPSI